MGKRVLFIVAEYSNGKINEETKKSITGNLGKEDTLVFVKIKDTSAELYCDIIDEVNKIVNDVNNFDYVCLVNNGSVLGQEAKVIFEDYQVDRTDDVKEIYLPLVITTVDDMAATLNKHMWNSMVAYEAGVLDQDLALKQADATIFGGFIPVDLFFKKEYYNRDLKYYQQYHLMNHLADGQNLILGIPKITLTVKNWDFKLDGVEQEEKLKNFELARENWNRKKTPKVTEDLVKA